MPTVAGCEGVGDGQDDRYVDERQEQEPESTLLEGLPAQPLLSEHRPSIRCQSQREKMPH